MRTSPRPRTELGFALFILMRPFLRFSQTRDAYVLRAIGNARGPVVLPRRR